MILNILIKQLYKTEQPYLNPSMETIYSILLGFEHKYKSMVELKN